MYVKLKVDENQDFKKEIVKRIQQELHEILRNEFYDIVKRRIAKEINFRRYTENLTTVIDHYIKEYVQEEIHKVISDKTGDYYRSSVDNYISKFFDEKMSAKFEELFEKRFGSREDD